MSALAVFLGLKIYSMIYFLLLFAHRLEATETVNAKDFESMKLLVTTGTDIIKSTYELIDSVEYIKQHHLNTPAFEVGYLMFNTFEKYRKMIDKCNTSYLMQSQLYTTQLVMYLDDIERHYWELDHMSSMLHEIERKYNVTSGLYSKYHEITSAEIREMNFELSTPDPRYRGIFQTLKKLKVKQKVLEKLSATPKKVTQSRFPLQYGWDYPDPQDVTARK